MNTPQWPPLPSVKPIETDLAHIETPPVPTESHAVLCEQITILCRQKALLRERLEELLQVHEFIDDDTKHQTRATIRVLKITRP